MTYDEVISRFNGSVTEAAYKLGVTVQTLFNWKKSGIPVKTQEVIALKLEKMDMDGRQQQEAQQERYYRLMAAFSELIGAKVSTDTLDTLKFETGLLPEDYNKLKGEKIETN